MTTEITIWRDAIGNIGVTEAIEPRARLEWTACGWSIFLRGKFPPLAYAQAANVMMNYLIERHVPAISIRRVAK